MTSTKIVAHVHGKCMDNDSHPLKKFFETRRTIHQISVLPSEFMGRNEKSYAYNITLLWQEKHQQNSYETLLSIAPNIHIALIYLNKLMIQFGTGTLMPRRMPLHVWLSDREV